MQCVRSVLPLSRRVASPWRSSIVQPAMSVRWTSSQPTPSSKPRILVSINPTPLPLFPSSPVPYLPPFLFPPCKTLQQQFLGFCWRRCTWRGFTLAGFTASLAQYRLNGSDIFDKGRSRKPVLTDGRVEV